MEYTGTAPRFQMFCHSGMMAQQSKSELDVRSLLALPSIKGNQQGTTHDNSLQYADSMNSHNSISPRCIISKGRANSSVLLKASFSKSGSLGFPELAGNPRSPQRSLTITPKPYPKVPPFSVSFLDCWCFKARCETVLTTVNPNNRNLLLCFSKPFKGGLGLHGHCVAFPETGSKWGMQGDANMLWSF